MKKILIAVAALAFGCTEKNQFPEIALQYPETKTVAHTDEYWGETVADPYRWLEDDNSDETKEWVIAQNKVTFSYLDTIPFRDQIKARVKEVWDYKKISAPNEYGEYTYYYKNEGLQNQYILYRIKGVDGAEELFLDPNKLSDDNTTSLAGTAFSKDGSLFAYSVSVAGSDWRDIYVMNTETMELMSDKIVDAKFTGISWLGNEGFYYSTYDMPDGNKLSALTNHHKVYFHKLGTEQSTDELIFGDSENPRRYVGARISEDQRYLVISAANSTSGNELYYKDLSLNDGSLIKLIDNLDNEYSIVETKNDDMYIYTNLDAPNNKVIKIKSGATDLANAETVIAETENVLNINTGGGYFFASYLKDAITEVHQINLDGSLVRVVDLPGIGTASGFGSKLEDEVLYYTFTSYISPGTIYKYDIASGESTVYEKPDVKFDSDLYDSKQVFYTSKDGTKVPMIITHKKGIALDGKNPTMLYGYGGFNVNLTPRFSVANIVWLENGGVYAVPNLRGGGEYGEKWHAAGTKMNKQNVFDDFIAAAEYLISEKYTSSPYLAISGGSNGGLLVGATMTQRPDLAAVALPAVGVMDMLRYHKFTAGAGWAYDYGTADESEEMYQYMKKYSPVHALKPGTSYPATLVTTADHDDRVVPAHSFKFAATLQAAHAGPTPTLIRIETNAGHGAGKPTDKIIEETADKFAFTWYNMKVNPFKK
jgi:prolyl oligopeptidase